MEDCGGGLIVRGPGHFSSFTITMPVLDFDTDSEDGDYTPPAVNHSMSLSNYNRPARSLTTVSRF